MFTLGPQMIFPNLKLTHYYFPRQCHLVISIAEDPFSGNVKTNQKLESINKETAIVITFLLHTERSDLRDHVCKIMKEPLYEPFK